MRLVFAGTPDPALPALQRLIDSPDHEVVAVLTRPDAAAGRRGRTRPSPVAQRALDHAIPVLRPASPNTAEFAAELAELAPDCCPVVAYGALLGQRLLEIPAHGWINLHFSLLPAWRGAAPVQAALAAGDEITGASTFRIEAALDAGPVYGVVTESIRSTDTAGALLARLADSGAALLAATLDGVAAGTLQAVPQPADGVSYAPKITVAGPGCAGSSPPRRSTARSGRSPRSRGPGRCWGSCGSRSHRWAWTPTRRWRWRPGSCTSGVRRSGSVPAPTRCG